MGQSRRGSPEGMRAGRTGNESAGRRGRNAALGAIVLLAAVVAIAIGDETARITVENLTQHSMVVTVADRTFTNVRPGTRVTYESGVADTVIATASYSPGQGVTGRAERTFMLAPGHASNSGTTVTWACMVSTGVSDGNGSLVVWKVSADTLAHP